MPRSKLHVEPDLSKLSREQLKAVRELTAAWDEQSLHRRRTAPDSDFFLLENVGWRAKNTLNTPSQFGVEDWVYHGIAIWYDVKCPPMAAWDGILWAYHITYKLSNMAMENRFLVDPFLIEHIFTIAGPG
jgi:hypothetical protein